MSCNHITTTCLTCPYRYNCEILNDDKVALDEDYDDYFLGLTSKEYEQETKEHFDYLKHLSKVDDSAAIALLNRCEDSIFSRCWVTDEQAEILYHTVLYWRDKALMYDMEVK